MQESRSYDGSEAIKGSKKREHSDSGEDKFVAPGELNHIIYKPEKYSD